jgi:hypothetical protein
MRPKGSPALVADEQDRRLRIADEVAQVVDDPPAGEHAVGGHDHHQPRRRPDALRFIGRPGDGRAR